MSDSFPSPSPPRTMSVRIACERLEVSLSFVEPVERRAEAAPKSASNASIDSSGASVSRATRGLPSTPS